MTTRILLALGLAALLAACGERASEAPVAEEPAYAKDVRAPNWADNRAAAQAYVMRGKHFMEQGHIEAARRDWMKVTAFFKAQKEAAQEAEDLLKENDV